MQGYMNKEALKKTITLGEAIYFSRSRQKLWHKGETSGNYLKIVDVLIDCDGDTLLILVNPTGPTCHKNKESCFDNVNHPSEFRKEHTPLIIDEIFSIIQDRAKKLPQNSYTAKLIKSGKGKISQKIVEESGEVAVALMSQTKSELSEEVADLIFHVLVGLQISGIELTKIWEVLEKRKK